MWFYLQYSISDTVKFFLQGLYLSFLVLLNVTRLLVLKNINKVQSNNTRVRRSRMYQYLLSLCVVIFSITYGVMSYSEMSRTVVYIALFSLHAIVIGLPWFFFIFLHSVMLVSSLSVAYKRHQNNMVAVITQTSDARETRTERTATRIEIPKVANALLQQVINSLLFQTFCIAIPHSYTIIMDFIFMGERDRDEHNTFTFILQSLFPFLNPIALGLFLKQRRNILANLLSFPINCTTTSSESTYFKPRSNSKEFGKESVKVAKTDIYHNSDIPVTITYCQPLHNVADISGDEDESNRVLRTTSIGTDVEVESVSESSLMSNKSCSNLKRTALECPATTITERTRPKTDQLINKENISTDYSKAVTVNGLFSDKIGRDIRRLSAISRVFSAGCLSETVSIGTMSFASTIQDTISYF